MLASTAFVFPGQGSQSIGMLADLEAAHPIINQTFAKASEVLAYDLWKLVQEGPENQLNQTEYTQAAMLTADIALFELLKQKQRTDASMMAGHSLGEYAALCAAGAISLQDAVLLVSKRGRIMQETVPLGQGAMAAIVGLSDEQVQTICLDASNSKEQVSPANYNSIGQVVIAGHTAAVNKAVQLAEQMQASLARVIPVSVPCHCPLLHKAAEQFALCLTEIEFKKPSVPVISNVDLSIYESPEQIRSLLAKQLYSPVRWVETIVLMRDKGITTMVESGPGRVLAGLIRRIDRNIKVLGLADEQSLTSSLTILGS